MPKLKTHRGMAKRVKRTAGGKFKRGQAYKRHILTSKSRKRKRALRRVVMVAEEDSAQVKRLLPYWKKM
ncbi:MAG TPA: 50S ribosomal protein L35 [Candidatus Xenobia bacterium]|nr:50S ribosomal protein L35 [Candidatus Xenobia bacterium]